MTTLLVSDNIALSEAISRYMHYSNVIYEPIKSTNFKQVESLWIDNLAQAETMIIDIFQIISDQFVAIGILYGKLFLSYRKNLIWFYTTESLNNEASVEHLPYNLFYLPKQLSQFLTLVKDPKFVQDESILHIHKHFKSQTISNSHN
jgi:hypothetical protein